MPPEGGDTELVDRALARLARFIVEQPVTVIAAAVLLTALAAAFAGLRLRLDTDRNSLIASDLEYARRYKALEAEFGDTGALTVVVEARDRARARAFADELAARCARSPDVFESVFHRVPHEALEGRALLFARPEDLRALAAMLEQTRLVARVAAGEGSGGLLEGLAALVDAKIDAGEPAREDEAELGKILDALLGGIRGALESGTPYRTPWQDVVDDGYAWVKPSAAVGPTSRHGPAGQRLVVLVQPLIDLAKHDPEPAVRAIRKILDEYRADPRWSDVHVALTGGPVLDVDEMETYGNDAVLATVIGFVSVIVLFMVSFRRILGPLFAGACLGMAIAFTLAWAAIWPGHLNLISIVFLEILVGLGIDFGIQLVSRYDEERARTGEVGAALESALRLSGRASAAGAVTTALAFLATLFADFQGIREFGGIAGVGIIFCLVTMLVVLPALVILVDRRARRAPAMGWWVRSGLARALDRAAAVAPRRVVLAWVVVSALLVAAAWTRVRYSGNLLDLQATDLESVQLARDLVQSDTIACLVADDPAQLEDYARRVAQLPDVVGKVESLPVAQDVKLREIARIASLVGGPAPAPPKRTPEEALASLRAGVAAFDAALERAEDEAFGTAMKAAVREIEGLRGRLAAIAAAARPDRGVALLAYDEALRAELEGLVAMLRREATTTRPVVPAELPPALRDRFVGKTGKLLMYVHPRAPLVAEEDLGRFLERIRSVAPEVTGVPVLIYETARRMKAGYERAGLIALVAISVYLVLHFRSLALALVSLATLAAGAAVGLGLLGLRGETLNPANMLAIPLTLGIGVCYAIQLIHRFRQAGPPVVATATGRAVLLSAATTMASFIALALAQHRGTASLGFAITFGVVGCLVAALGLAPAILALRRKA